MKFKTGDKVKFLDETGTGIITKIINDNIVNVAIEDGFEIPTLINNLIKINDISNNINDEYCNDNLSKNNDVEDDDFQRGIIPLENSYSKDKETHGIYFAFIPQNQVSLITGYIDIYLINHTDSKILYSLYLKKSEEEEYLGTDYGIIDSESKLIIDTIERKDLGKWEQGLIEIIFYKIENTKIIQPVSKNFKIKPVKLYKEDNYKNTSFLKEKAFILMLSEYYKQPLNLWEKELNNIDSGTIKNKILAAKLEEPDELKIFINKHIIDSNSAEVDMHIWKLTDNYSKMTNYEMLKIQLGYFKNCLKSAMLNRLSNIVFIHGVGNGTLKKEIIKILDQYPEIEYKNASMSKYGVGATEIKIHYNYK